MSLDVVDAGAQNQMAVGILNIEPVRQDGLQEETRTTSPITELDLERELPVVYDGQIPLGDLLSRVMQSIYAQLTEMAETLPSRSDTAKKETLANWVVKTKKQVVKLYALVKWSRDAETVQKCMNITAFLMTQNHQFTETTRALADGKDNLDPARLRNHDLLTSLDVLTTGSYLRLPTCIKKRIIPPTPLTDEEVQKTLVDMENVILSRLRMSEIIPVEMSRYRIADGRVHFTVPKLFETSICLQGAESTSGWFLAHVEFLIDVKGDLSGLQEFPRKPSGIIKQHITDEADFRLAFYLLPDPERPKLPEGVVDTPLVRLYNFLQMMSLSYQLEILWFQAERMRSLGWAEYMSVQMSPDRKKFKASYWLRPTPPQASQQRQRSRHPTLGGSLTISIDTIKSRSLRTPREHLLARLQHQVKLGNAKPSDEVEGLKLRVDWEPSQGVLGVNLPPSEFSLPASDLEIDAEGLDFESLLLTIIEKHTAAILVALKDKLQHDKSAEFSTPGIITSERDTLHVHLCADEVVTINIDPRTGRLNLRDTNGLVVAGRAPRFYFVAYQLNQAPELLVERLSTLRLKTILDLAEQKAQYLGFQSYRTRNFKDQDLAKLGNARGTLFIQLTRFPNHYLVLVVKAKGFSYALITTNTAPNDPLAPLVLEDIAFLNFDRIHGERMTSSEPGAGRTVDADYNEWVANDTGASSGFDLTIKVLKEVYSYCCARVAYMNVERQFKLRAIPFTYVNPGSGVSISSDLARIQSSLARSVPALCVQATDILSGAPAAEAAMPNIRVIPLNWWSEENAQVVTCVKLKYVQQPLGKRAGSSTVIRPSKRIIYDAKEAVVSFLSENVNTCVDEFLEEWARVSKMVVIAREVAKMSKEKGWKDIQLLSFDLQTVEFAYAPGYSVSITCEDQLSVTGGKFDLRFSRYGPETDDKVDEGTGTSTGAGASSSSLFNPHDDAEPFLSNILRHGHGRLAASLERLVGVLRDTLPIAVELESIRRRCRAEGYNVDTFAKASGWYRLLYPDLKHALDFRLMTEQRVAILDASHSLFERSTSSSSSLAAPLPSNGGGAEGGGGVKPASLIFQPIPGFAGIVKGAVAAATAERKIRSLADITVGVICETSAVGLLAQALHTKVVEELQASS